MLDSNLAKQQRNDTNQASHDFTIHFNPPFVLDSQNKHKPALNKVITMSYSWYNIAEAYGNNKLKWRKKPGDWQFLTFPDGMYDPEITPTSTVFCRLRRSLLACTWLSVSGDDRESWQVTSRSSLIPLVARSRLPAINPSDREPGTG